MKWGKPILPLLARCDLEAVRSRLWGKFQHIPQDECWNASTKQYSSINLAGEQIRARHQCDRLVYENEASACQSRFCKAKQVAA